MSLTITSRVVCRALGGIIAGLLLTACGADEGPGAPLDAALDMRATDAGAAEDADLLDATDRTDADAASEAGPPPPASDFAVHLGLGARQFTPVEHGATALLQRGCQGAQHVWLSLRSPALQPGDYTIALSAARADDGREVVPPYRLNLPWTADPDGGAALVGVQFVIFDALEVVEADIDVLAEVEETPGGRVGRTVLRLRIEWGPDEC